MPAQQPRRGPVEETPLVFVGERRSRRAVELGAHWTDGRLCAKTLHDALRRAGVDPAHVVFLNLFHDEPADDLPCENALQAVRSLAGTGACIVALGRRVQAALTCAGVAHVGLVHPAARGAIRARRVPGPRGRGPRLGRGVAGRPRPGREGGRSGPAPPERPRAARRRRRAARPGLAGRRRAPTAHETDQPRLDGGMRWN